MRQILLDAIDGLTYRIIQLGRHKDEMQRLDKRREELKAMKEIKNLGRRRMEYERILKDYEQQQ